MDAVESLSRQMFKVNEALIGQALVQEPSVAAGDEHHQVGVGKLEVGDIALDLANHA